jgi:hypothetical protein
MRSTAGKIGLGWLVSMAGGQAVGLLGLVGDLRDTRDLADYSLCVVERWRVG